MLTYLQAVVIGLLQGVTELFPVSSLGHSILVPALIGGSWRRLVTASSTGDVPGGNPYLAFIVGLHVATALALLVFFRREWVRIIGGLLTSIRDRRVETSAQRLGWLLVVATIPAGLTGLIFEHTIRTVFAKPVAASVFLFLNGFVLLAGERLRRRDASCSGESGSGAGVTMGSTAAAGGGGTTAVTAASRRTDSETRTLARLSLPEAFLIGVFQVAALFAGISRSGITIAAGLLRGLDHEDAARFSFLLATPIILAAGVLKLPDLFGPNGNGIRGQVLAGSVVSGLAAYASVRFLTRYFRTRTLTPFAIYCWVFGAISFVRFAVVG